MLMGDGDAHAFRRLGCVPAQFAAGWLARLIELTLLSELTLLPLLQTRARPSACRSSFQSATLPCEAS